MRRSSLIAGARTRLLSAGGVIAAVCAAALLVVLGGACGGSTASSSSPLPSPSGKVVLTLVGEKGERRFTMNQLEALPSYTGYGGIKSSTGTITLPSKFTGVRLSYLTDLVGGISKSTGVTIVGSDGYGMTFSSAHRAALQGYLDEPAGRPFADSSLQWQSDSLIALILDGPHHALR